MQKFFSLCFLSFSLTFSSIAITYGADSGNSEKNPFGLTLDLNFQEVQGLKLNCGKRPLGDEMPAPIKIPSETLQDFQKKVVISCLDYSFIDAQAVLAGEEFKKKLAVMLEETLNISKATELALPAVTNLNVKVDRQKFNAQARVKYGASVGFYMTGEASYSDDEVLKIQVYQAKLGFVPVTRAMFAFIQRLQFRRVRAEMPFLYIDLSL